MPTTQLTLPSQLTRTNLLFCRASPAANLAHILQPLLPPELPVAPTALIIPSQ
jgi:hypothetical protein